MKKIFETILPGWTGPGLPKEFPWHVRLALRSSVLVAHLFAILYFGLPFNLINPEKRDLVMKKICYHSNAGIRNIFEFWKLTAFMTKC